MNFHFPNFPVVAYGSRTYVEVVSLTMILPFNYFHELADFASRNVDSECYPEVGRLHRAITCVDNKRKKLFHILAAESGLCITWDNLPDEYRRTLEECGTNFGARWN